jgi:hypothetical protein
VCPQGYCQQNDQESSKTKQWLPRETKRTRLQRHRVKITQKITQNNPLPGLVPALWRGVNTSESVSSKARAAARCVALLGPVPRLPALFLASCLRLTLALPAFFLALRLAARPKNPVRESRAKQLWQTFKRDVVQNFKAQLEDCRKHRCEYRGANRSPSLLVESSR